MKRSTELPSPYLALCSGVGGSVFHRRRRSEHDWLPWRSCALAVFALGGLLEIGCVGVFADDGTSTSVGTHSSGALIRPVRVPVVGDGYRIGEPWRRRESQFATDEVAEAVVRVSRRVARLLPDSVIPVGDISHQLGGGSPEHRSHQNGRDFDLFFPSLDAQGMQRVPGDVMLHFDRRGRATRWSPPRGTVAPSKAVPETRFDAKCAWVIVRALLTDPSIEVQWIFVQKDLAALILEQAGPTEGPIAAKAAFIIRQPSDSEPHDDHMHVRAYCDPDDRDQGCADRGALRWLKKGWKYLSPPFEKERDRDVTSRLTGVLRSRTAVVPLLPTSSS